MANRSSNWAPWYWYVVVLAPANAIAQFFFLSDSDPITNTIITVVLCVVLMLVVTLAWRATGKERVGSRH